MSGIACTRFKNSLIASQHFLSNLFMIRDYCDMNISGCICCTCRLNYFARNICAMEYASSETCLVFKLKKYAVRKQYRWKKINSTHKIRMKCFAMNVRMSAWHHAVRKLE